MTSKWRERLFSPTWSTGERVYVVTLWAVIVGSLVILAIMGYVLSRSL